MSDLERDVCVEVFSATRISQRLALGERVTDWLRANGDVEILDRCVLQSSDASFHCVTIVLVYTRRASAA